VVDWIAEHVALTWLAAAVLLAMIELASLDFVLLMFAFGALSGAIVAGAGGPQWLQIAVFAGESLLLLFVFRPALVHKLHAGPTLATGFQNLIGTSALVLEPVDSRDGRVRIGADEWSARTHGTETIEAGTEAHVVSIDGATAVVTAIHEES
jgi:membrane protein implicated in regulation of membrane protease activity